MGQHKYNPTAQAAKEGKLPPKPEKISKREQERQMYRIIRKMTGLDYLDSLIGGGYIGWYLR